jgi:phosphoenolpyruvate carboxykinase (ATP)
MHCSVNVDKNRENPAIFFGLSGTGKTTLSSDPNRILIGDDEHGWTDDGLTNFEGGCYAKTIRLSKDDEPEIWKACHTRGTILENVVLRGGGPDFDDDFYTENGRASYPTTSITNADADGYVDCHPTNVIMLTCDAFGVLPPVIKLTPDEAIKQFSLGYTAKVAGTEAGVTEPVATFSPCFGAPFMPLPARAYADLLKRKVMTHNVQCWLVNTGWTGGPYGTGKRMPIRTTRLIIDGILDGTLAKRRVMEHKYTGFYIPLHPGIGEDILFPERGWNNLDDYKKKIDDLLNLFKKQS